MGYGAGKSSNSQSNAIRKEGLSHDNALKHFGNTLQRRIRYGQPAGHLTAIFFWQMPTTRRTNSSNRLGKGEVELRRERASTTQHKKYTHLPDAALQLDRTQ